MEPTQFFNLNEIDFNKLTFLRTKQNSGKKFINTAYDKKPWGLKLPKMNVNFNTVVDKWNNINLTLSLGENESLLSRLNELDNSIQEHAEENGWIDNSEETRYLPIVKGQVNGTYPQYVKFKFNVDRNSGQYTTSFFKKTGKEKKAIVVENAGDIESLFPRGTPVIISIEANGIWFMNNQWGITFKIGHVLITEQKVTKEQPTVSGDKPPDGYLFEESSDSSISEEGDDEEL